MMLAGFLCLLLLWAITAACRVCGPVILPDEFGYWAQAAHMAGMDWREVVSRHSWYSFGYGFFMLPFIKLSGNPVTAYRLLTAANFFLLGAGMLLLYRLLPRLCSGLDKKLAAAVSGAAMLYVSYLTYAQTALAETMLTFLYILLAYGLERWLSQKNVGRLIFVLLTAGYMYTVHMRTIGILLVTVLILLLSVWGGRERKTGAKLCLTAAVSAVLILILFLQSMKKAGLISDVGSESYSALTRVNDYAGQWGKIKHLFSIKGIGYFLSGLCGKIFYLGCASFGLYYWGMADLIKKGKAVLSDRKRKEACAETDWFYLWVLLSHAAALLITALYCIQADRLDGILYGRYHENTLPFITAFGIMALFFHPLIKKRIAWLIGLSGAGFFFIYGRLGVGLTYARHSVTGILYAFVLADFYDGKTILYAYLGALFGGVLLLGFGALQKSGRKWLPVGVICIQLINAAFSAGNLLYPYQRSQKEDMKGLWQAKQLADTKGVEAFCYLSQGAGMSIYTVQYALWDTPLQLISDDMLLDTAADPDTGKGFFVVPAGESKAEELSGSYTVVIRTPHYEIYCNE